MSEWIAFPYDAAPYRYDAAALKRKWTRLHAGDVEPRPTDDKLLAAWRLFHAGAFGAAVEAGRAAGGAGSSVANKAQLVYANYLERNESRRLALYLDVAARAEAQAAIEPGNANAFYFMAHALGRYGQAICLAQALMQGLGFKVKAALETAIRLAPRHADAHLALGAFHATLIDKFGAALAAAHGANQAEGIALYRHALELNPASAHAKLVAADGLALLEGENHLEEADALYAAAAASQPMDALERLDVEIAMAALVE